jgi:hypothetical protein
MKLSKKIENLFAAAAFAEAGEHDTARAIAAEKIEEPGQQAVVTNVKATKPKMSEGSQSLKGAGSGS